MTLESWFKAALKHGTVYYVLDNRPRDGMGMHAYQLYTIVTVDGKPSLERAWPLGEDSSYDAKLGKELGFRTSKRAWCRAGCGYDRVYDICYTMARHFGYGLGVLNGLRLESLHGG